MENLPRANIYVTHCQGESESDFDRFLNTFGTVENFFDDVSRIVTWIDKIGRNGALERYFRSEGSPAIVAIPIEYGSLRLYCIRLDDKNLILGGGGLKTTRTYQEDPVLYKHVLVLRQIDRKIRNKMKQGSLNLDEGVLNGINDVCFDVNVEDEKE